MGKISKALEKSRKEEDKVRESQHPNSRKLQGQENTEPFDNEDSSAQDTVDLSTIHGLLDESGRQLPPTGSPKSAPPASETDSKQEVVKSETPADQVTAKPPISGPENRSAALEDTEQTPESRSLKANIPSRPVQPESPSRISDEQERETKGQSPQEDKQTEKIEQNELVNADSPSQIKENNLETKEDAQDKIVQLRKTPSEKNKKPKSKSATRTAEIPSIETGTLGKTNISYSEYKNFDQSLVTLLRPRSFEAEQFKLLRTNILFPVSGEPPRSILVTSALPGDGKSFVASNLAVSFALNLDRRVLLIDADIRKPEIHDRFGIDGKRGLSDYLTKATPLPSLLRRTNLNNLTILPGGRPPHNPSELLSSEKMPALLKEVTNRYKDRYVIVDSPPPKLTSETSVLARLVDGIVLVVRTGVTARELVEELVELLGKEKILGVVMNCYDARPARYYGYGKYGKYYGKYYGK
jgi:exopolysaccharide/PEP-CTERM locus tyrosine autokinase